MAKLPDRHRLNLLMDHMNRLLQHPDSVHQEKYVAFLQRSVRPEQLDASNPMVALALKIMGNPAQPNMVRLLLVMAMLREAGIVPEKPAE